LKQIGMTVTVRASTVAEVFDERKSPEENAADLALQKAVQVGRTVSDGIIIGADTIVVVNGLLLGKPESPAQAIAMLELLAGRTHKVVTGFALVDRPSDRYLTDAQVTDVTFRPLPRDEIEEYVAGGSPMDKAGAYGIQDDYGAVFVTRIEGCFYNVVGFPLARFYVRLREFQSLTGEEKGALHE